FSVLGKGVMQRHSPLVVSGITCLGGALSLAPLAAVESAAGLPEPSLVGLTVVVYLGALVTFAGMVAWFWALLTSLRLHGETKHSDTAKQNEK
ncbi:MAG: EamA family transporter, partial [Verrucomicrobiota bacterium]|nr:EamA family transporter [Verrucomicrobiota bacterium]